MVATGTFPPPFFANEGKGHAYNLGCPVCQEDYHVSAIMQQVLFHDNIASNFLDRPVRCARVERPDADRNWPGILTLHFAHGSVRDLWH